MILKGALIAIIYTMWITFRKKKNEDRQFAALHIAGVDGTSKRKTARRGRAFLKDGPEASHPRDNKKRGCSCYNPLIFWRPQRDSKLLYRLERAKGSKNLKWLLTAV
jgi:hypothetical protein